MKIDFLVKLGGSLLNQPSLARLLLGKLVDVEDRIALTVGSGPLGDAFKSLGQDDLLADNPNESAECWSAIQSVNARVLKGMNQNLVLAKTLDDIVAHVGCGRLAIVDALPFSAHFQSLQYQTTDVRSAHIAGLLGCRRLVVVTDVNGVFTDDPKRATSAVQVKYLKATDALLTTRTSVDVGLPEQLVDSGLTCFVIGASELLGSALPLLETLEAKATIIAP